MFLSRVLLTPARKRHLDVLTDCYQMHQFIASAFPDNDVRHRPLFRPEEGNTGKWELIVQSLTQPDWDRAQACLGSSVEASTKEFSYPVFIRTQKLRFRIRANPVKTIRGGRDEKKDSRGNLKRIRVPLVNDEQQLTWLRGKLSSYGARLVQTQIQQEGKVHGHKGRNGAGSVTLYAARFDGTLEVEDNERFQRALQAGIGPAKGFGFGLLSVAPV